MPQPTPSSDNGAGGGSSSSSIRSIIPFDIAVAESYGLLTNLVRTAGRDPRLRRLDLLIAATAERHGLSLATRNAADFRYLERVLDVVEVP